jgi:hypothetical protein
VNGPARRRIAKEWIDDWDKAAAFWVGANPRRSTSSLGGAVNDTPTASSKRIPDQVITALLLLGVQYFLAVLAKTLQRDWAYFQQAQIRTALFAAASAIWLYGLYRRLSWLRWVTVVFTGFQVVALPVVLPRIHYAAQLVLFCASILLGVAATVLLCMPKARQWYD